MPKRIPVNTAIAKGKSQDAAVHMYGRNARDVARTKPTQRTQHPVREHQSNDTTNDGEQHTLSQQLTNQADTGSTQCAPNGYLALAYGGPRQQKIRLHSHKQLAGRSRPLPTTQ
jgi:hypothetical protein